MRREKELPKGRLSGEAINLLHVLRDIDIKPGQMDVMRNTLDDFENEIDYVLEARARILRETRFQVTHAMRGQNIEDAIRIYQRQIDARVAVRAINDRYTQQITSALPGSSLRTERNMVMGEGHQRKRTWCRTASGSSARSIDGSCSNALSSLANTKPRAVSA